MVWLGGELCGLQREDLGKKSSPDWWVEGCSVDDPFAWETALAKGNFGYVCPPKWYRGNPYYRGVPPHPVGHTHGGLPHSTGYARCVIESPDDMNLWAGIGVNQQGRLWVNDRLVWTNATTRAVNPDQDRIIVRMRKGTNKLLMKIEQREKAYGMAAKIVRTLSAAGPLQVIACALAFRHGLIPPTANYEFRDRDCDLDYVPGAARRLRACCAIVNAHGVGGGNSSMVLEKAS
jgi:hypothetical protein